ncbi:hypothetical protein ACIQJT_32960 [Streptomyces sp. NPDC091972]|uniref:hypothetical protein n=1 Tax=Streptomyces sp. NPDC091972 TaxID=3366007 RepID=UPI0037F261A1
MGPQPDGLAGARPADGEIDIEFAVQGDPPMSSSARRAEPGDRAGIFGIGTVGWLPEHAKGRLPAGEMTALPAISIFGGTPP